jgi:hypothetical protein
VVPSSEIQWVFDLQGSLIRSQPDWATPGGIAIRGDHSGIRILVEVRAVHLPFECCSSDKEKNSTGDGRTCDQLETAPIEKADRAMGRCGDPRSSPPSRGVSAVNASLGVSGCRMSGTQWNSVKRSIPSKHDFDVKRPKRWTAQVLICSRCMVCFGSLCVEVTGIDFFLY